MIRKSIATAAMIVAFVLAPAGAAFADPDGNTNANGGSLGTGSPDICSDDRTSANYCPVAGGE